MKGTSRFPVRNSEVWGHSLLRTPKEFSDAGLLCLLFHLLNRGYRSLAFALFRILLDFVRRDSESANQKLSAILGLVKLESYSVDVYPVGLREVANNALSATVDLGRNNKHPMVLVDDFRKVGLESRQESSL